MKKQLINQSKLEAIKYLKSVIKPKSELFVNISSVSSGGMSRKMAVYAIGKVDKYIYKNGVSVKKKQTDLIKLNFYLHKAEICKLDKNGNCIVSGCGMDMAFDLTYTIKTKLWGYKQAINNQQYRLI
jgi:hypothetical protein